MLQLARLILCTRPGCFLSACHPQAAAPVPLPCQQLMLQHAAKLL